MHRWRGRAALVTGASSGFGYAIAKQLVELGMNVVGCARSTAKIQVDLDSCATKYMCSTMSDEMEFVKGTTIVMV